MPPLGVASIISIELYAKLRHAHPPSFCNLGGEFERKNGQNLREELFFLVLTYFWAKTQDKSEWRPFFSFFFFWSSPNFGQENGLILSGDLFVLVFIILKFPVPLFSKIRPYTLVRLRYAWATRKLLTIYCLHDRKFALGISTRWNHRRVSDYGRERLLLRVAQKIIDNANRKWRRRFLPDAIAASESLRETFLNGKNLFESSRKNVARVNAV